jgi:hypothetical protein
MEVHAHSHTERKKWTHYLWEFLMLFLAVFCGFLAENLREHKVEKGREKQYMVTLLEDLKADTASFNQVKNWYEYMLTRKDSVITNLHPPVAKENVLNYYNEAVNFIIYRGFTFHDRTIEQLKNSGGFRLISNRRVSDSLAEYDSRLRGSFSRNNSSIEEKRDEIRNKMEHIIDEGVFFYTEFKAGQRSVFYTDDIAKDKRIALELITDDKQILMDFYNSCVAQIGYMYSQLGNIGGMKNRAEDLILLIQKEYHLK